MRQTVIGVFEHYADARSAQRTLGEAGVAQADIAVYSMSADAPVEKGPRVYAPDSGDVRHHNPVFDQLEQLFARLFKSGQYPAETEDYRELIRRGGTIVSADVSATQVDLARDLMRRSGATDIEERAKVWRNGSVERVTSGQTMHQGSSTTRDYSGLYSSHYEPASTQRGEPITHGEQAGRAAGTAGLSRTTEYVDDPRDMAPVATAPTASTRETPAVRGTVTQGTAASSAMPNTVGGMQQVTTRPEASARTGPVGDLMMSIPLDDAPYDDEFRDDYDTHYASTGASYDEYQRAYSHGATLGQDERYRGQDWQRVEANARENWESRYPDSGWERFKAAVRHGWARVTGG
jgi:hypothetical protein